MEKEGRVVILQHALLLFTLMLVPLLQMFPAVAEKYRVGGCRIVGDFIYQKGMYDVVEVNWTAYDACSADDPIVNWSKGHNFVIEINETKTYYFICSRVFCYQGMKLKVVVEPLKSPSPAPEPATNSGGGWTTGFVWPAAIWFALLAWTVALGLV